jgi:hypothetical protein
LFKQSFGRYGELSIRTTTCGEEPANRTGFEDMHGTRMVCLHHARSTHSKADLKAISHAPCVTLMVIFF